MTSYGIAVLLVVFGFLLLALDLLLVALTPFLLRKLAGARPESQPGAILLVRFAPVLAALLLTVLVFLPAWFRHEPEGTGEGVSLALLVVAGFAALPVLLGFSRAIRMFMKTRDRLRGWRNRGRNTSRVRTPFEVVEVKSADLALCVGGYLRPTIYASTDVIKSLEPEELSAALAHEVSHAHARDPLRLLGMGSCPDFLQWFRMDDAWRRAFSTACEFAADAGASRGNPERALDLASALLKVARLRTLEPPRSGFLLDVAVSSAFSSRVDLEARVEALTNPPAEAPASAPVSRLRPWMFAAAVLLLSVTGALASEHIHAVSEAVGRFLAP